MCSLPIVSIYKISKRDSNEMHKTVLLQPRLNHETLETYIQLKSTPETHQDTNYRKLRRFTIMNVHYKTNIGHGAYRILLVN